ALAALAAVTDDCDERQRALREGWRLLARGGPGFRRLFFYRDAMDAAWAAGDGPAMAEFAAGLDRFAAPEPTPWSRFFVGRGRALAAHLAGDRRPAQIAQLRELRNRAVACGLRGGATALRHALAVALADVVPGGELRAEVADPGGDRSHRVQGPSRSAQVSRSRMNTDGSSARRP
ncbi:MAG: hypothetical protein AAGC55_28540, partial [Myxococcota bacterium]